MKNGSSEYPNHYLFETTVRYNEGKKARKSMRRIMNNAEFYAKFSFLMDELMNEIPEARANNCETRLLEISTKISDLILSRFKKDWAGNEMLGKLIGTYIYEKYEIKGGIK